MKNHENINSLEQVIEQIYKKSGNETSRLTRQLEEAFPPMSGIKIPQESSSIPAMSIQNIKIQLTGIFKQNPHLKPQDVAAIICQISKSTAEQYSQQLIDGLQGEITNREQAIEFLR